MVWVFEEGWKPYGEMGSRGFRAQEHPRGYSRRHVRRCVLLAGGQRRRLASARPASPRPSNDSDAGSGNTPMAASKLVARVPPLWLMMMCCVNEYGPPAGRA